MPLSAANVAETVVNYVARTRQSVSVDDPEARHPFFGDAYFAPGRTGSVLCLPLSKRAKLLGVLYLENNLTTYAFTPMRATALSVLASQAAISLENSQLYAERDQAEERLALIIDTIPTLVWCTTSEGSAEFFNRQWLEYTGLSAEQARGSEWLQALHPQDASAVIAEWRRSLASGQAWEVEGRLRKFDGEYRWFLFRAEALRGDGERVIRWYGTNTDIEARKRAELELDSRLRFMTMLSQISARFSSAFDNQIDDALRLIGEFFELDGVTVFWFTPDRQRADATHAWVRSGVLPLPTQVDLAEVRYGAKEILSGREVRVANLQEVSDVQERTALQRMGVNAVAALPLIVDGQTIGSLNFTSCRARAWSGEAWARISILGKLLASALVRRRALTELELSDAALQGARVALAHATRVATLGELAATIAHEINQPLAAIVSDAAACLKWLSAHTPDVPSIRESLVAIVREGGRAGQVLTRIRALIARSEVQIAPCEIRSLIEGVLPLTRGQLEREGVRLETALYPRPAVVLGDAVQLQQVVLNLVMNAAEATCEVGREHRRVRVRSTMEAGEAGLAIVVAVEDTGIGIGSNAAHLFETFYTTKPGGLGLGLPICRSIIERHGGRLWAESNADGGATFRFSLAVVSY